MLERELHKPREEQALWYRAVSWPLEKVYGVLSSWNAKRVQPVRLPQPMISVGNLTVGGTGKSPVVVSLCSYLKEKGLRPAVLTRGYGAKIENPGWMALQGDQIVFGRGEMADEAAMEASLLKDVPVIVGPRRAEAAIAWLSQAETLPDVWVMDDGFQHRAIFRDVDLVCVDDHKRFGNARLLPAGPLREPLSAMHRASAVLLTRSAITEAASEMVIEGKALPAYRLAFHYPNPVPLHAGAENQAVPEEWAVVCGIAQPERFRESMQSKGMRIVDSMFFADHQNIDTPAFHRWFKKLPLSRNIGILTTAKDAFRNRALFLSLACPVYIQPLELANAHAVWDAVWDAVLPDIARH